MRRLSLLALLSGCTFSAPLADNAADAGDGSAARPDAAPVQTCTWQGADVPAPQPVALPDSYVGVRHPMVYADSPSQLVFSARGGRCFSS